METIIKVALAVTSWYVNRYGDEYARKELARLKLRATLFLIDYNEPDLVPNRTSDFHSNTRRRG